MSARSTPHVARRLYQEEVDAGPGAKSPDISAADESAGSGDALAMVPAGKLQEPLRALTAQLHGIRAELDEVTNEVHAFASAIDVAQSRNAFASHVIERKRASLARLTAPDGDAPASTVGLRARVAASHVSQGPWSRPATPPTPDRGAPVPPGTAYSAVHASPSPPHARAVAAESALLEVSVDSLLSGDGGWDDRGGAGADEPSAREGGEHDDGIAVEEMLWQGGEHGGGDREE